jgi:hypothetical protein
VFYVGKGLARRAWWFKQGRNPYHRSIIEKHGAENITVTLHPCVSEEAAFELEKVLIAKYSGLGVRIANQTDGGEGASGRSISDRTRAAFDDYRANKPPMSDSHKAAVSVSMKKLWETNPAMRENATVQAEKRRGVKRPPHVVAALVKAHKGKVLTGERLEKTRASLQVAQEAAKAWHSSEEGRKWHEEHGKKSWANREWVEVACKECGRPFHTPCPTRAKWCCTSCCHAAHRRKQGKPVGVRPNRRKPSLLSGKRAVGE